MVSLVRVGFVRVLFSSLANMGLVVGLLDKSLDPLLCTIVGVLVKRRWNGGIDALLGKLKSSFLGGPVRFVCQFFCGQTISRFYFE